MNGIAVLISLGGSRRRLRVAARCRWSIGIHYPDRAGAADSLESGREIVSEIHPEARSVRRFRVRVGTGALPRVGGTAVRHPRSIRRPMSIRESLTWRTSLTAPIGDATLPRSRRCPGSFRHHRRCSGPMARPVCWCGRATEHCPGICRRPMRMLPPGIAAARQRHRRTQCAARFAAERILRRKWLAVARHAGRVHRFAGPPPNTGSGFQTQPSSWQGGTPTDSEIPHTVSPVPGPGPETGFPSPIRSSQHETDESIVDREDGREIPRRPGETPTRRTPWPTTAPTPPRRSRRSTRKPPSDSKQLQAEHPWVPLVLTSLALFGSLAANAYLGWVAVGIYHRYREMCEQLHEAQASLT